MFSEPGHQALRQQEFSVAAPSVDSRGGAASGNGNCEMWKKQEIRWPLIPGRQIDLSALVCLPAEKFGFKGLGVKNFAHLPSLSPRYIAMSELGLVHSEKGLAVLL